MFSRSSECTWLDARKFRSNYSTRRRLAGLRHPVCSFVAIAIPVREVRGRDCTHFMVVGTAAWNRPVETAHNAKLVCANLGNPPPAQPIDSTPNLTQKKANFNGGVCLCVCECAESTQDTNKKTNTLYVVDDPPPSWCWCWCQIACNDNDLDLGFLFACKRQAFWLAFGSVDERREITCCIT